MKQVKIRIGNAKLKSSLPVAFKSHHSSVSEIQSLRLFFVSPFKCPFGDILLQISSYS